MNNIVLQEVVETLEKNYMPYAMSVIVSRAIPEIDGLKPSHRKLLYTMYKMGLLNGPRTKSANVVGQTMKLNPHGDMAIYETLVRLTRGNSALLFPYIDSKGNFGKQYSKDMKFAAPRYTEVKLDKICEELFGDLEKNVVDFIDNYDGTMKEPVLLPSSFPTILVNPNQGIAVGMASNICSFNLKEICEATIEYIKDENVDFKKIVLAPDFPTGGNLIYSEKDINDIYENGKGSLKVRASWKFDKKASTIEIYEIPYTTTTEAIIDSIIELAKNGKIKDITDVRDETDINGLKIAIDIRKSSDCESLMNKLYKLTSLQDSFNCNFNILVKGTPKVMGLREIICNWVEFRIECIKRGSIYEIQKKSDKLHLLIGLSKILLNINKAIDIVKNTEDDMKVIPNLMVGFDIDKVQAEFVAEIKLRNFNKDYILKRTNEIESLRKEIDKLSDLIKSETKIKKVISKQLQDIIKKYGSERKTKIISEEHIEEITDHHLIEDYRLKIFLTKENYLKKIPLTSLRSNPEHKLKEDDVIIQEIDTKNKIDLMLFSSKGHLYKLKVYEIPDCKASSLGEYLTNLLKLDNEEVILYITVIEDYTGYMLYSFENGKVAKIDMSCYQTKTNRKKLANAYSIASRLVSVLYLKEDCDLIAISDINKVLVFNSSFIVSKSTRDSHGVQVLKSKKGSKLEVLKLLSEAKITDDKYYRTENIPAIGFYLKEEDFKE